MKEFKATDFWQATGTGRSRPGFLRLYTIHELQEKRRVMAHYTIPWVKQIETRWRRVSKQEYEITIRYIDD